MIKKVIFVKKEQEYLKEFEYSQGYLSYSTTPDPLKALDIESTKRNNPEFVLDCFMRYRHAEEGNIIKTFQIEVEVKEI
jgi:hypothetical protein